MAVYNKHITTLPFKIAGKISGAGTSIDSYTNCMILVAKATCVIIKNRLSNINVQLQYSHIEITYHLECLEHCQFHPP